MTKRQTTTDFAEAKPFEIFRAGVHRPMAGDPIAFAEPDVARIAASYDPSLHEAPIVVGHPAVDAPAYGWIGGLASVDGRLVATPVQVNAEFADLVRAGSFKKVSASFYRPGQAGNPKPDGYYLRHVGFLGAQPPAVKGLRPVEFAGAGDDCVTIEFAEDWATASSIRIAARLFRSIREWLIGSAGQDTADRVLSDWDIQSLADLPAEIDPPTPGGIAYPAYADPTEKDPNMPTKEELDAREAALREREASASARDAAFAEAEATRRRTEDLATIGALIDEGRLPKASRGLAEALFAEVGSIASTVDFADGDETVKATPRELLGRLLASMPLPVPTGELAFGEAGVDGQDPQAIATAITAAAAECGGDVLKGLAAVRRGKK